MEGKQFLAKGSYYQKGSWKKFSKTVEAASERRAMETLLSLMGSQHKIKRHHVKVTELKEAKPEK